jgi:simple sugar transport system permease protein
MDELQFIVSLLVSALRGGSPILFVLLGEIITQRAGAINLGIEGQMLMGAFAGFAATAITGNPWFGLVAGVVVGVSLSGLHAILCLALKANPFASGVAVLLLGGGLSAFFGIPYVGTKIDGFGPLPLGPLENIPLLGPALKQMTPTVLLALILVPIVAFLLRHTLPGLKLQAVGEQAESARGLGIVTWRYQALAILIGGALSGLGGAALSVDYTRNWIEWMTAGRGLIALGLVIVAGWRPSRAIAAALLFGGSEALALKMQTSGVGISSYLLGMLPYLVCLLVLIVATLRARKRGGMPAELAAVFKNTD